MTEVKADNGSQEGHVYTLNFLENPHKDYVWLFRSIRDNWVNNDKNVVVFPAKMFIGSYFVNAQVTGHRLPVIFRPEGMTFFAPHYVTEEQISIRIRMFEMQKVLFFGNPNPNDPTCMATVRLHINSRRGVHIKRKLGMDKSRHCLFQPWDFDDKTRYITLVFVPYPMESMARLQSFFGLFMIEATNEDVDIHDFEMARVSFTKAAEVFSDDSVLLHGTSELPELRVMDVKTLCNEVWMNAEILDFAIKSAISRLSEADRQRIVVYPANSFGQLTSILATLNKQNGTGKPIAADVPGISISKIDIFTKDFVVIPVNYNGHWILAIVCFPGLVNSDVDEQERLEGKADDLGSSVEPVACCSKSVVWDKDVSVSPISERMKVRRSCILLLNSLTRRPHNVIVESMLRKHLQFEFQQFQEKSAGAQVSQHFLSETTVPCWKPSVAQQVDKHSCGIYTWKFIEGFFKSPPELTPDMNLQNLPGTDLYSIRRGRQELFDQVQRTVAEQNRSQLAAMPKFVSAHKDVVRRG